jgi:hypothetical protein
MKEFNMRERIQASVVIGNIEQKVYPDIAERVHYDLVKKIADEIGHLRITSHDYGDFSKEFRVDVIVADPNDYWRDVEQKAMEMMSRYPRNYKDVETLKDS